MPSGLILKGVGGNYYVMSGKDIYECKARGLFRKDSAPMPGDKVFFDITDNIRKKGYLMKIENRISDFVRPLVANAEKFLVMISATVPKADYLLVDKLLVTAAIKNVKAAVCINKYDLTMNAEDSGGTKDSQYFENSSKSEGAVKTEDLGKTEESVKAEDIYRDCGYPVFRVSMKTGLGLELIKDFVKDSITVLAGQSGVGKSTLLNRLTPYKIMETGELSIKTEKGKHTTRHSELVPLPFGGFITDTPGFSSYELTGINKDELKNLYNEFSSFEGKCRFKDCNHRTEPGCAVLNACEAGIICKERHENYLKLFECLRLLEQGIYK